MFGPSPVLSVLTKVYRRRFGGDEEREEELENGALGWELGTW